MFMVTNERKDKMGKIPDKVFNDTKEVNSNTEEQPVNSNTEEQPVDYHKEVECAPPPMSDAQNRIKFPMIARAKQKVYIRTKDSIDSTPLSVLDKGEYVIVLGSNVGGYNKVQYGGYDGYIMSNYIERV